MPASKNSSTQKTAAFAAVFICLLPLLHPQGVLSEGLHPANDGAGDARLGQLVGEGDGVSLGQGDEQAARGLRVGQNVQCGCVDGACRHEGGGKVEVPGGAAGDDAHGGHLGGVCHDGHGLALQGDGDAAAPGQLESVADEPEAGDVGAGAHIEGGGKLGCRAVEGGHDVNGGAELGRCDDLGLGRCGQNTRADLLGEHQQIAQPGPAIGPDAGFLAKAGDTKAVLGHIVLDAVAAGDDGSGLGDLALAAGQDVPHGLQRQAAGEAQQIEGQGWRAAHSIDVGEGVGRGNLAEEVGVIHHRWEEVGCLNEHPTIAEIVDAGVVALVEANQQGGILGLGQVFEHI